MPADRLDALALVLLSATAKQNPLQVALDAGFPFEEIAVLCSRPDAISKMLNKATVAYLVPCIPTVIRRIAEKAAGGAPDAEKLVLELLGNKSSIRDQMGVDVTAASDDSLGILALQLVEQLQSVASLQTRKKVERAEAEVVPEAIVPSSPSGIGSGSLPESSSV